MGEITRACGLAPQVGKRLGDCGLGMGSDTIENVRTELD